MKSVGFARCDVLRGLLASIALQCASLPAAAQSLNSASIAGTIQDALGRALFDVEVTAVEQSSGLVRRAVTSRAGQFRLALLPPGQYDVLAETVGYRPKQTLGVPLFPGNDVNLTIDLISAPPPVDRIDTVSYRGAALNGRGSGMSPRYSGASTADFADRRRDVLEYVRHASDGTEQTTEGFPGGRLLVIDGVPFIPARHSALSQEQVGGIAVPLLGVDRAELLTNPVDVEWRGVGGGILAVGSRRGSNRVKLDAFGDWTGRPTSNSKFYDPAGIRHDTWRGGVAVGGPLVRDTANFALGIEGRRAQTPFPPLARSDSSSLAALALARDSFHQDVRGYDTPRVDEEKVIAGFGRFDWQIAANHSVSARIDAGSASIMNPHVGLDHFPSVFSRLKATDFTTAAVVTSNLSPRLAQELRVGVAGSRREYFGGSFPATVLVDPALRLGSDPALAGRFDRTEVQVRDVVHLGAGRHLFKAGAEGNIALLDDSYAEGRGALFIFADPTQFAARQGAFRQVVGTVPVARFNLPRFAGLLQDTWAAAPGLRLTLGVRYDYEGLPQGKILRNDSLAAITGLDNSRLSTATTRLSPRLGFTLDVGRRGAWIIRGAAGLYPESVDPSLISELITNSRRVEVRSATGPLPSWPAIPDSTRAPIRGREISLVDSAFVPPRTAHVTVGISRALGGSAALHLFGTYRHTDFLPRRHDLNRVSAPSFTDNHGRPIFGVLQQFGGQLGAAPGSNSRFSAFDHIWALDQDGFSDYKGVTIALDRESRAGLQLHASYTYGRTTDNWLSRPGLTTDAQVTPFPAGLNGQDWAEGVPDLDIPHNVSAGVLLPTISHALGFRLGVLYSYRSGYPFTPGFRDGVDVNADGSNNDPAYVDEAITGTADLYGAWSCLLGQAGRFAARNSCRSRGIHRLDVRVRTAPLRFFHLQGQILIDGLNLMDSADGLPDRALYLVDAKQSISTDAATGVVSIPLIINPGFGRSLVRLTSGRSLRIGLRLTP